MDDLTFARKVHDNIGMGGDIPPEWLPRLARLALLGSMVSDGVSFAPVESPRNGKIIVPGTMANLNNLLKAARRSWGEENRIKQKHTEDVAKLCKGLTKCETPVMVRVNWVERNRRRDPDNIFSASKFILDGLVRGGVLEDDGQRWVAGAYNSLNVDSRNPRVEVSWYETELVGSGPKSTTKRGKKR